MSAQDEQVGDGTTSVIVLAGEYLNLAGPLLERQMHPTTICNGYLKALDDAVKVGVPWGVGEGQYWGGADGRTLVGGGAGAGGRGGTGG